LMTKKINSNLLKLNEQRQKLKSAVYLSQAVE